MYNTTNMQQRCNNVNKKVKFSYQKFGLKENPFKSHYGFTAENPLWAGSQEVKQKIEQLIDDITASKMQQYAILCGEYGTGKSYSLLYFQQRLNLNPSNKQVIGLYVENPGNSVQQFYRTIIQGIGSATLIALGKKLVGEAALDKIRNLVKRHENANTNVYGFFDQCRETFSFDFLWPAVAENYEILSDDLAKSITWLGLVDDERRQFAWKWMTAAPLTAFEMRKAKLSKQLGEPTVAEVLSQLLHLIHFELEMPIIVMIDEFEDLLAIKEEALRIAFLRGLRRIIDGAPNAFGLFIACTADGWRDGLLAYHPLASRLIKENFIPLNEFDQEMTKRFIANYLSSFRIDKAKKLFPFADSAVEEVFRITHGNPREIVKSCRICLRMKLKEPDTEITRSDVKRYLGEKEHELL